MESHQALAELDALRLSDWIQNAGISRSAAYELLKLLSIEPEPRRVPGSRKPVSHLTAEQMQALRPWAHMLATGSTLPQVRDRLRQSAMVPDGVRPSRMTAPDDAEQSGIVPAMAAALAAALPSAPPSDPLRTARLLKEAADLGVPLSNGELAQLLGMAPATVGSWADGHQPRPGFLLRREKVGAAVWWTVERPGPSETVRGDRLSGKRVPGFVAAALAPAIDTPATVVSRLELPSWR